jgi:hypothetical protein
MKEEEQKKTTTSYLAILVKFASIFRFWVQLDMNNRTFTSWPPYVCNNPSALNLFTTETEYVFCGVSVEVVQFATWSNDRAPSIVDIPAYGYLDVS